MILFAVVVCARDGKVQVFKPNLRGMQVAGRRLRVVGDSALYVGDRPHAQLPTARNAGVRGVISGRAQCGHKGDWLEIAGYNDLREFLFACRKLGLDRIDSVISPEPGRLVLVDMTSSGCL